MTMRPVLFLRIALLLKLLVLFYTILTDSLEVSTTSAEGELRKDFKLWLINEAHIVGKKANQYMDQLFDAGVGSYQKLGRKISKDQSFLSKLGFDETDVEDIAAALRKPVLGHAGKNSDKNVATDRTVSLSPAVRTMQIDKRYVNLTHHKQCSKDFANLGTLQCLMTRFRLPLSDIRSIPVVLTTEDSNNLVRRLEIHVRCEISDKNTEVSIGDAVDIFLTPRPWWTILSEGWREQPQKTSAGPRDKRIHLRDRIFVVMLIKQSQLLEPQFRFLASIQFPPSQEICSQSRLRLGHMINSGWGAQTGYYGRQHGFYPWTIVNIWDSYMNTADEGVPYANGDLCPSIINKRLCAFLPVTNCSMPAHLTEVSGEEVRSAKYWPADIVIYTNASAQAMIVPGNDEEPLVQGPQNEYQKNLIAKFEHFLSDPRRRFGQAAFTLGTRAIPATTYAELLGDPAPRQTSFAYGLLLRPNARYRALINARVLQFRQDHKSFPAGSKCVAMHIRRGDRMLSGLNMTKYCGGITKHKNGTCTDRSGADLACWRLEELGCFYPHPFGSLRLQDYLDRAWALLPTRNIFVMTDDHEWLANETATVAKTWRVASISGSRENHWSEKATQSGVDFLASVALARRCEAFVGHWGSSVAHLVHRSMCLQHGFVSGQCPPACDIGAIVMGTI